MAREFLTRGRFQFDMNVKGAVKGAERGATKAMKIVAKQIEQEISKRAAVDTGELRDSVKVTAVGGKKPRMEVRTVEHGLYVEFGTVNMEAQPFIRPVIQGQRNSILKRIAQIGRKELERGANRKSGRRSRR